MKTDTCRRHRTAITGQWRNQAVCKGFSAEIWFAEPSSPEHQAAKTLCGMCPVIRECALTAIELLESGTTVTGRWAGVWIPEHNGHQQRDRAIAELYRVAGKEQPPRN